MKESKYDKKEAIGNNNLKKVLLLIIIGLITVLETTCIENRPSFYIVGNKVPDDECIATDKPEGQYITEGLLDICVSSEYLLHLLVKNQLVNTADNACQAEANTIIVEEAHIRIWLNSISYFTIDGVARIDPIEEFMTEFDVTIGNSTAEPNGYGVVIFNIFTPPIINAFNDWIQRYLSQCYYVTSLSVSAGVTLYGKSLGGLDMKTQEMVYPVTICYGCLVPPVAPNCEQVDSEEVLKSICDLGQDKYIPSAVLCVFPQLSNCRQGLSLPSGC